MRASRRLLLAVVGPGVFLVYATLAAVLLSGLAYVWRTRPDLPTTVAALLLGTVGVAYLSYRLGSAQLLAGLDATVLPRDRAPGLYERVDALAARMDLDPPRVAVARLGVPNAMAVGGPRGVVVLDASLFTVLDPPEMEALLAHELAHLEGRDALVQTVAVTATNTVSAVLLVVLSPALVLVTGLSRALAWAAGRPVGWSGNPGERVRRFVLGLATVGLLGLTLAVFAHSRRRELAADDRAAEVTGRPLALASALRKLEAVSAAGAEQTLYTGGDDETVRRWLSTHPDTDERVARLRARAGRTVTGADAGHPPGPRA